jgi:hypothetical protein
MDEPFCKPFGNRRVVHCLLQKPDGPNVGSDSHIGTSSGSHPILGEIPAWETCGRSVAIETADFWEFVVSVVLLRKLLVGLLICNQLCNIALASVALFILYTRSRAVASVRRKALVARIGIRRTW